MFGILIATLLCKLIQKGGNMFGLTEIIVLVVIAIIIIKLLKSKKKQLQPQNTTSPIPTPTPVPPKHALTFPKDYLEDGGGWVKAPKPLKEMLKDDKENLVNNLIAMLKDGGTYEKKWAAFCLGQIGEGRFIGSIKEALAVESVQGVQEAMAAAITALNLASVESGKSELERRTIINEVYDGKRKATL